MIEDKATEKLKKQLKKIGLIVNAGADKTKPKAKTDDKKKKGKK